MRADDTLSRTPRAGGGLCDGGATDSSIGASTLPSTEPGSDK
jgi:hypothetical protein